MLFKEGMVTLLQEGKKAVALEILLRPILKDLCDDVVSSDRGFELSF